MFVNIFNDNSDSTRSDIQDVSIDDETFTLNEEVNLHGIPAMKIATFAVCASGFLLSLSFLIAFICSFLETVDSSEIYRIFWTS